MHPSFIFNIAMLNSLISRTVCRRVTAGRSGCSADLCVVSQPGQVQVDEDGCTQVQCVDNQLLYDSSGCPSAIPTPPPSE